MPRPSVIPDIKARLENYLNEREVEFMARPESSRAPTIPSTSDGKVNVRALAEAIGLKRTQEKYLYERHELLSLVNMMAEGQGLRPIGSRLAQEAGDKSIVERLARSAKEAKNSAQAAIEVQAVHAELLDKLTEAVATIEKLQAENTRLRAQLNLVESGVLVRIES